MIVRKLLGPLNLIKTWVFGAYETINVVVIDKHKIFLFAMFEIVALCFESFDKC